MKALKVLVTRPLTQGKQLAEVLAGEGFKPLLAPMIEIERLGPEYLEQQKGALSSLSRTDGIIAISSNAFVFAYEILQSEQITLTENLRWFAVGSATAASMSRVGINALIPESSFDTEGLLSLPEFANPEGKQFVILAGRGGRRRLELELQARGAHVDRIELYQRKALPVEKIPTVEEPDAIIAMSGETLAALIDYLMSKSHARPWLGKPLFVPSARIADQAFEFGFTNVRLTENALEKSLIQALCRLASEV